MRIIDYFIDLRPDLNQVCLERFGVLEFPACRCFLDEGFQQSFLFEQRLECVCHFRVWINDLLICGWKEFQCRLLGSRQGLAEEGVSGSIMSPKNFTNLQWKHVLL